MAVGSVRYGQLNRSFVYSYTPQGNISAVTDGDRQSTYQYDEINQLIRENNAYLNKTVTYSYGDSEWKDLLTAYNGQEITYDAIGNPLSYKNGFTFTWKNGRRLATATANGKSLSFEYDDSGYRTQKKVNGVATDYLLDGDKIVSQIYNNQQIWFDYDAAGTRHAMEYNGNNYYYYYNLQGDVIGLYDSDLNSVVQYSYDSWGKLLSVTGSLAETVGKANPFRYRGYYYDSETELYYLNSRYYDPETGRFVNADGYVSGPEKVIQGYNIFVFCDNNPVNKVDDSGNWPKWIKNVVNKVSTAVKKVVSKIKSHLKKGKNTLPAINHVNKSHVTEPLLMLDLGSAVGKVGLSSTVSKSDKMAGIAYSFVDVGNNNSRAGVGAHIDGISSISFGVDSEINGFFNVQITPFVHGEISLGAGGIGFMVGIDSKDTSVDLEVDIGPTLIALFISFSGFVPGVNSPVFQSGV